MILDNGGRVCLLIGHAHSISYNVSGSMTSLDNDTFLSSHWLYSFYYIPTQHYHSLFRSVPPENYTWTLNIFRNGKEKKSAKLSYWSNADLSSYRVLGAEDLQALSALADRNLLSENLVKSPAPWVPVPNAQWIKRHCTVSIQLRENIGDD
ncbi:hypothetical protein TNCV_49501 [Trichonephila clavipes]|nr:hypothetical protein TNCV_49501 [Trichonephila clavipes]